LSDPIPIFRYRGDQAGLTYIRQFAHRVENDAYGAAWTTPGGADPAPGKIMFDVHAELVGMLDDEAAEKRLPCAKK
jgi:hypothetical protein